MERRMQLNGIGKHIIGSWELIGGVADYHVNL